MRKFTPLLFAVITAMQLNAASFTATTNGAWNVGTTWGGACATGCVAGVDYPGINDDATIPVGRSVTVPSSFTNCNVRNLTLNGNLTLQWHIRIHGNTTNTGTIPGGNAGRVVFTGTGTTITGTGSWGSALMQFFSSRTITAGSTFTKGGSGININSGVTVTNQGTCTFLGQVTGLGATSTVVNENIMTISGTSFLTTGRLDADFAGNSVTYGRAGTQTIKTPLTTYNNLTIQGSGAKTMAASLTLTGNFTIAGTASLNMGNFNMNLAGNWTNTAATNCTNMGTVTFNGTGAQTITRTTTENFNHLTYSGTGSLTLGRDINLTGNYNQSSGVFDAAGFSVIVGGTYDLSGGSYDCGGGTHTVAGNFTHSGGTYDATAATLVLNGTAAQVLGGFVQTQFNNLTISNTAGVTLGGPKDILSTGTVTITAGDFDTGGFDFTLISDASGTARIAEVPAGSSLLGASYTIQRFIPGPAAAYWDFLCAPADGSTFARWDNVVAPTPFYMSGIGGNDGNACCPIFRSVRRYDEGSNSYVNITSTGTAIAVGTGYMIWVASTTSTLGGNLIFDTQGSVTSTGASIPVTSGAGGGYNLIGNPVPSQILWSTVFAASSNLSDQFLILDETLQNYASWNGTTSTGTGQLAGSGGVINSTQGFMVLATAGTSVVINENAKTALTAAFVRSPDALNVVKVKLSNNFNRTGAESMISFLPGGDNNFESSDLPFLKSPFEGASSLKLLSADNKELMSTSVDAHSESHEIPMKVSAPLPGMYSLSFAGLSNIRNYNCVYLRDVQTGKVYNLKKNASYSFLVSDPGVEHNFVLYFENEKTSGNGHFACRFEAGEENPLDVSVNMYADANGFNLDFNLSKVTPVSIAVYNTLGELVVAPRMQEVSDELITVGSELSSGLYIIRVEANGETINRKLYHY